MIDLIAEAASVQDFVESNGWEFFFIGGITVQVWGRPRMTEDIDLTIFTNLENESEYIATFLERYTPKFSEVEEFALTNRVLPLFAANGIGIDVTLGGLSDTSEALARSSYQRFSPEIELRVCSPDDLIIMKAVAARPQDWIDLENVVTKQQALDWDYILSTIQSLDAYDDVSARIEQLAAIKSQFYRP